MLLKAKIITPEKTLFEGEVTAVQSFNATGEFSILPQHTNFISIIKDKIILFQEKQEPKVIELDSGVIYHNHDTVEAYIGIKEQPGLSPALAAARAPMTPGSSS